MKKQLSVIAALLLMSSTLSFGQGITINRDIYGINAWYIDAKGAGTSTFAATFESELNAVKASGCRYVRIGGIAPNWDQLYDFNNTTLAITNATRVVYLCEKVREAGKEVIIQVSYNPSCPNYTLASGYNPLGPLTLQQQATVAANLVEYLNNTLMLKIEYWIISNEPDLPLGSCSDPRGLGLTAQTSAGTISTYIKEFSWRMKSKSPGIKIIAAELAQFGTDQGTDGQGNYFNPSHKIMADLVYHRNPDSFDDLFG